MQSSGTFKTLISVYMLNQRLLPNSNKSPSLVCQRTKALNMLTDN